MRTTHTYAVLRISRPAFQEIKTLLEQAGYREQFHEDPDEPDQTLIDMHGIALGPEEEE